MTKKRFEFREVNYSAIFPRVYDTEKQQYANLFECVHWLNELNEENEQLKNRLKQTIHEINDYTCIIKQLQDKIDVKEALLKQYEDENEQLKSEYKVLHSQYQDLKKFVENNFDEHLTQKELNNQIIKLFNENEQLKQQIKDLQVKNDSIEWLRNNTVWEQIPSIIRTSISTNTVENPYCDKRKVNKR